jgi:1-acyl-sn-glycerol-3-phosphate acyltransferase
MGAYSLIRGVPDRESFMMTKKLLIEGLRPLVIFIEGEISNQNDLLMPFESGVIQLAFKAQEEISDSVKLLPIALKYTYEEGVEKEIKRAIIALEQATNIKSTSEDLIERIRNIGEKVLQIQEKRFSLSPSKELTLTERIKIVKEKILDAMEDFLGIREHSPSEFLDRIRKVRNHMDKLAHSYNKPDELSFYEERIIEHLRKTYAEFYDELDRLVNFLIFDGDYLTKKATPERFVEIIKRLEREIYGHPKFSHPRTAQVRLGEVIDLKDHLETYLSNKKAIVKSITNQLELTISNLLKL